MLKQRRGPTWRGKQRTNVTDSTTLWRRYEVHSRISVPAGRGAHISSAPAGHNALGQVKAETVTSRGGAAAVAREASPGAARS